MRRGNLDLVEDASAHYGNSQEQDVQGDESRQKPSPVATLLRCFELAMGKYRTGRLSMAANLDGGYLVLDGFKVFLGRHVDCIRRAVHKKTSQIVIEFTSLLDLYSM